ncbi:MAG: DUF2256 domain-containing protein [Armatimonadota bacterium]
MRNNQHLPQRNCRTCGRPFAWRKKWARVWDQVQYCSKRCRNHRPSAGSGVLGHVDKRSQDRP